jgi:hypothetical protein
MQKARYKMQRGMKGSKSYAGCYWAGFALIAVFVILLVRAYNDAKNFADTIRGLSHIQDHQPNDLDLTLPKLDQMFKADPKKAEAALIGKNVVMTGKVVGYQTPKVRSS